MESGYILPKIIRMLFNRPAVKESIIDKSSRIDIGSVVASSTMGRCSYVGEHTSLIATDVGSFTSISNYCAIGGGSHPIDWVSMSPVFNSSKGILKKKYSTTSFDPFVRTRIGNDVWIGSHCLIKSGVSIGDGAVVGMGSVVTKDIGSYEIWAGNPARMIRKRFADEIVEKLLQIEWWNWTDEEIERTASTFNDIEKFMEIVR